MGKDPVTEVMLEFSKPQLNPRDYLDQFDFFEANKAMAKEILSLRGHIRRLEKSNQELGEENNRLQGTKEGWNRV